MKRREKQVEEDLWKKGEGEVEKRGGEGGGERGFGEEGGR